MDHRQRWQSAWWQFMRQQGWKCQGYKDSGHGLKQELLCIKYVVAVDELAQPARGDWYKKWYIPAMWYNYTVEWNVSNGNGLGSGRLNSGQVRECYGNTCSSINDLSPHPPIPLISLFCSLLVIRFVYHIHLWPVLIVSTPPGLGGVW